MQYDMNGNIIENEHIETDRKFWAVPVIITSNVWEEGYHIYEADSAEEALEKYESEIETPHEVEYTGWLDQEYKYDELMDEDCVDDIDLLNNNTEQIQYILRQEKKNAEWLASREENERDEREEANREGAREE